MRRWNRNAGRLFLALLLAAALTANAWSAHADGGAEESMYTYRLYVTNYVDNGDGSYELQLGLFAYVNGAGMESLDGGSFGLRVPTNVSARFEASGNISVLEEFGSASEGGLAFIWTCTPSAERGAAAEIKPNNGKPRTVFGTEVNFDPIPGGLRMHMGTFKLTISAFPARNSIGLLDWSKTSQYEDAAFNTPVDASGHCMNDEIWNGAARAYQGYYQDKELNMRQADVPLAFSAPTYWPNAFSVLSYDPKKPAAVTLSDVSGEVADAAFTVPQWAGGASADSGTLYAASDANKDTGESAYYAAVDMGEGVALENGKTYTLTLSKPGHLPVRLSLTGTGGDMTEALGFPEEAVYLPAGDIDGNGRIDMADRAILLGLLGTAAGAADSASYRADIDGDGRVTMADLSILMSPMNYTKKAG